MAKEQGPESEKVLRAPASSEATSAASSEVAAGSRDKRPRETNAGRLANGQHCKSPEERSV